MGVKEGSAAYSAVQSASVPMGYKQTEVGVIPEDWEVARLGSCATFRTGPFGSALHKSDYVHGGVPIINPMQIVDGKLVPTATMSITEAAAQALGEFRLSVGEVVIGRRGDMGRCAVVGTEEVGWLCGTGSMILRPRPSVDGRFIQRMLSSPPIIRAIESTAVGTTMVNLNQATLSNLVIPLPPQKNEQEAIAEALSDADALIESLEQLLTKKRQLKQGAMQELLTGKNRLPGFSGEWQIKCLGDLFEITSSKRVFQSDWKSDGVPFYRARELAVLSECGYVDNDLFISVEAYKFFKVAHGVPEIGDVLVTGVGTLGKVYIVSDNHDFYFKDGNIIWFKVRGSVSSEFLRQLYLTPMVMKQIIDASAGTTAGTYTISGAKKTQIPFPSIEEQIAIAKILSDMDAELATLEDKLAKAQRAKQGMMQELLTGAIRLIHSDTAADYLG